MRYVHCLKHRLIAGLASGLFVLTMCLQLVPVRAYASSADDGNELQAASSIAQSTEDLTDVISGLIDNDASQILGDGSGMTLDDPLFDQSLNDADLSVIHDKRTCTSEVNDLLPACVALGSDSPGRTPTGNHGAVKGAETGASDTKTRPDGPSDVAISNKLVAYTKAVIHVENKQPTKIYVRFGVNGNLSFSTPVSSYATAHDIQIKPTHLVPGNTYAYEVVSIAADGTRKVSPRHTFTTKGFTVYVTVLDKRHRPLRNQRVVLHSTAMAATTDKNGVVRFDDVAPGTHHLEYEADGTTHSQAVRVTSDVVIKDGKQFADVQRVSVVYDFERPVTRWQAIWSLIGAGIIIVAGLIWWLVQSRHTRRRNRKAAALREKMTVYAAEPDLNKDKE